jgi:GT2 family glycosyltransferase/glycosyltransferase involved in cell wall biosynthesis
MTSKLAWSERMASGESSAVTQPDFGRRPDKWGTTLPQRLRLAPLWLALTLADALAPRSGRPAGAATAATRRPGISVVIPERDAPAMLDAALASVVVAMKGCAEPLQIIVVVNGAPRERYRDIVARYPTLELVHQSEPSGFSAAIARGLQRARYDWTLLLNNDMTLAPEALRELAAHRGDDVFAIAAQIMQLGPDGRREETGFTDWYVDPTGIRVFHAPPEGSARPTLCASGGAGLFRTALLRRYARASRCYDPFYWEDVEWGVRAQRDGYRVVFCPSARASHRHRATTARFYSREAIERVVERNRILFDLRNAASGSDITTLLQRVCDQPYASQRELAAPRVAARVLASRWRARRHTLPSAPPVLAAAGAVAALSSSYSFSLAASTGRPRVLLVSPFCVFPARHGGARRIEGLLQRLRREFDIVLVTDEASLYDARSLAHFEGLHAVLTVQRPAAAVRPDDADLDARMEQHGHALLRRAVREALQRHRPDLVQIEYAELAGLSSLRTPGQRWVLGLHDAYDPQDFRDQAAARRFQSHVQVTYDAVTVCSPEDRHMIAHPHAVCVPNGANASPRGHAASTSAQLLFMGPFRYAQNLEGIRRFLRVAYPAIKLAVPETRLLVLGGDGASDVIAGDAAFAQPGVDVMDHREDVAELLDASALTVNPLSGIRGSSVKVIESLAAGRTCVTTDDGARGFAASGLRALVTVRDIEAMAEPIIALLRDDARRRDLERPDAAALAPYLWHHCAGIQGNLYRTLLGARHA